MLSDQSRAVPVVKQASNTVWVFRRCSMYTCFWSHATLSSSPVTLGMAQCSSKHEHWFTLWCGSAYVTRTHKHAHTYPYRSNPVQATEEVAVGSCMCVDWSAGPRCPDSLPSTFSQPRHLCDSAVTRTTMAAACEPARLPRTQRWLRQPLTLEAATKRPETSIVGSSVNRPETPIYSALLK